MREQQLFRVITELRKAGNLDEAWNVGCPAVQENPQNSYLKGSFFWVCYEHIKQTQAVISNRGKTGGNYLPNQYELERINFFLDWIEWLKIPPGGYEYRSLLFIFKKNLEAFPRLALLLFTLRQGLFEDEDKIPYRSEKGESPSLMLTFARKMAKCWLINKLAQPLELNDLRSFFDQVRQETEDRQHIIWLDYDEAKCLVLAKKYTDARAFIIPVLRKKQSEAWAWGALAATYIKENQDTAISLFAQGILHSHDEKFALKPLKSIAVLLAERGYTKEASMCIQRAISCYQVNGWSIREDLSLLQQQPWFDASVNVLELNSFLKQKSKGASDSLHGPSQTACGLVINHHKSGKGLHLYLSEGESIPVSLRIIKNQIKPNIGDYLLVTVAGEGAEKSVLSAEITSPQELLGVETYSDKLYVRDKGFGFVGDTFIPPFLIKEGMDQQQVKVLRYKDFDKKKGKLGWRALSLDVCT